MSFGSDRKAVMDEARPLAQRASHARSCALHVAQKLGVSRSVVLGKSALRAGVDLDHPADAEAILKAFAFIDELRQGRASLST
jgi:hypothetical protein